MNRDEAIKYLLNKLKWCEIDAAIALKNGDRGVLNYKHGEARGYKSVLWDLYGVGSEQADAMVAIEINGRA